MYFEVVELDDLKNLGWPLYRVGFAKRLHSYFAVDRMESTMVATLSNVRSVAAKQ